MKTCKTCKFLMCQGLESLGSDTWQSDFETDNDYHVSRLFCGNADSDKILDTRQYNDTCSNWIVRFQKCIGETCVQ